MSKIDPVALREKFQSAAAKKAFDTLNQLGPDWVFIEDSLDGRIYLSPSIEIKTTPDSGILQGLGNGWGRDLDEIIVSKLEELREILNDRLGTLVVVNAYQPSRKEYAYDSQSKTLYPYKKNQGLVRLP